MEVTLVDEVPLPPPQITEGAAVGSYVVRRLLAVGGSSSVFEALDARLHRTVALKVMSGGDELRDRVLSEARAQASVTHPNVAAVYDVGNDGSRWYIAMRCVTGQTLASWNRCHTRTWRSILRVALAIGRGLVAVHRAQLVHRDIKPSNIFIDNSGRPFLVDFGLAASLDEPTHFAPGSGTPRYMAPEQERGQLDPRSDQYSYAIMVREALDDAKDRADVDAVVQRDLLRAAASNPTERFARLATLIGRLHRRATECAS
jgi:serine/threonine protein kinase